MNSPLLQITQLTTTYADKKVIEDLSLTLAPRDFLTIYGPNGGGKTTLVKTILGLHKPYQGKITFYHDGQPVPKINIGYLPQRNQIDPQFPISVIQVLLSGLQHRHRLIYRYNRADKQRAAETLHRVGLSGYESRPIGQLSGGELQRVLLGRAIICEPRLLILDEPSTYLDKPFEEKLYALLHDINKQCAIILISHDLDTTLAKAQRVVYIDRRLYEPPPQADLTAWLRERFAESE